MLCGTSVETLDDERFGKGDRRNRVIIIIGVCKYLPVVVWAWIGKYYLVTLAARAISITIDEPSVRVVADDTIVVFLVTVILCSLKHFGTQEHVSGANESSVRSGF
jgi:hypothetical protein